MFQSSKGQILNQNDIVVVEKKMEIKDLNMLYSFFCVCMCAAHMRLTLQKA